MRSFFATNSTMQCAVFNPAKNEEMTHPFLTSGYGAPLKVPMRFLTILNMQYPLYISNNLPMILIPSQTFLIHFQYFWYSKWNQMFSSFWRILIPHPLGTFQMLSLCCIPNQYFQYPIKTLLFDNFEFPIPCIHFQYSLNISKTQHLKVR